MSAKEKINSECKAYFDQRANFKKDACRQAAEELKQAFIDRALHERYFDYIEDRVSQGGEILQYKLWIEKISQDSYDRLIEMARPGFKEAVLKTLVIKRLFEEGATHEEMIDPTSTAQTSTSWLESWNITKRKFGLMIVVSASLGASLIYSLGFLPEESIVTIVNAAIGFFTK